MMRNRRDRAKIVALCIVLGVVWVVIGVRYAMLSREWRAKAAAALEHGRLEGAGRGGASAGAHPPSAPRTGPRVASLISPLPPPGRDPFHPLVLPRSSGAAAVPAAGASEEESGAPPLSAPPMPLEAYPSSTGGVLRISGIVLGTPSIAVLRRGESHYVVREGDWLEGQLRVQGISRSTVTLQEGKKTYVLRLGQ